MEEVKDIKDSDIRRCTSWRDRAVLYFLDFLKLIYILRTVCNRCGRRMVCGGVRTAASGAPLP